MRYYCSRERFLVLITLTDQPDIVPSFLLVLAITYMTQVVSRLSFHYDYRGWTSRRAFTEKALSISWPDTWKRPMLGRDREEYPMEILRCYVYLHKWRTCQNVTFTKKGLVHGKTRHQLDESYNVCSWNGTQDLAYWAFWHIFTVLY